MPLRLLFTVLTGVWAGVCGPSAWAGGPAAASAAKPAASVAAPVRADDTTDDAAFGVVSERVLPAVARIAGVAVGSRVSPFGSGVVISPQGHVLTLATAMLQEDLSRGIQPKVTLADGRTYPARIWLRSRTLDAAVLKIDPKPGQSPLKGLAYLTPGDSETVQPGHWLILVGNAFNLAAGEESPSVNLGVVSAVVDKLEASVRLGADAYRYQGPAIVTDANNNPGSYGGPMLDATGAWVGLTGRIVNSAATNTQINYGIPVGVLKPLITEALARTKAAPDEDWRPAPAEPSRPKGPVGYHGIGLFEEGGQLPPPYVDRLDRRSPARKAGLRTDDLVQYINGRLVQTCRQFHDVMGTLEAGSEVRLTVLRGRTERAVVEIVFRLETPATHVAEEPRQ